MDHVFIALLTGIGLSAACGFRVFVPMLVVSVAAHGGYLDLAPGFEWIGAYPAMAAFAVATALEIGAYYVPWLDNLLDAIATPAAVVAGTVLTASVIGDLSPFLRWSLALIAGGGAAAAVQAATVTVRGVSTATSGGLLNPLASTGELAGSILTSVLAVFAPVAAILLLAALFAVLVRLALRRHRPAAA
jgi:hypothetical protein